MSRSVHRRSPLFWVCFGLLAIVTAFWAIFALLSGAEEVGLIANAPNALPWLALGVVLLLSYRFPTSAGLLFLLAGLFSILQFETYRNIFTFALISLPYVLGGGLMAFAGWRARRP